MALLKAFSSFLRKFRSSPTEKSKENLRIEEQIDDLGSQKITVLG